MRGALRYFLQYLHRRPAPLILLYHRIADPPHDPWGLAVRPEHFADQLQIIKSTRIPLSMGEFVEALNTRRLPRGAIAVTFDDGYRDNLTAAKPLLESFKIPATIFLVTGSLGAGREFWWDELSRLVFGRKHPVKGTIELAGQTMSVEITLADGETRKFRNWRAWNAPQTSRQTLYLKLWQHISAQHHDARRATMQQLRDMLEEDRGARDGAPMSKQDVSSLLLGSGIEIGAHSVTHPRLTAIPPDQRRQEIDKSKAACELLAGKPVDGFTYPYGALDQTTKALVMDSGFKWACSANHEPVDLDQADIFALPRIQMVSTASRAFLDFWRRPDSFA
jgi:peptidoglycan/xylan/chitin deacetylase (PgdA/CDA1 family)